MELLVANDNERKALGIGRVRPSGLDMTLVFILDLSIESIQMFYSIQVWIGPLLNRTLMHVTRRFRNVLEE